METRGNSRSISRDPNFASTSETKFASRTRHGTKLRDILKCDKPVKSSLSYADFHYEITRNPDVSLPKYIGSQRSQVLDKSFSNEDELVKYMSNLPSYLEKDGSSAHSSRRLSFSPARQRVHRLQSTLEESPKDAHVRDAKSSHGRGQSYSPASQRMLPSVPTYHPEKVCRGGRTTPEIEVFGGIPQKFQDLPDNLSRQRRVFGALHNGRKESDLKLVSEMGKRSTFDKYEAGAPWKGKSKTQAMESVKETIRSQDTMFSGANRDFSTREKSRDDFMPRDLSKHKSSSLTDISIFKVDGRLSVDPCKKTILGRNKLEVDRPKNNHNKQLDPCESSFLHENGVESSSHHSTVPLHHRTILYSSHKNNAQGVKGAPQARIFSSPSRCRNAEEKKSTAGSKSEIAIPAFEELVSRRSSASVPKARNPSPIRRLGSAMGKMIKNAGSRDNSPARRSSSKERGPKSVPEGVVSSVLIDNPYCDKLSTNNNRGRSSPLRRLLDPFLRPRTSNGSEPLKKNSSPMVDAINSCNEPLDIRVGPSVKVNLKPTRDGTTLLRPQAQALLQVSFKNGLPLFTFAIDNESNILAATVRKSRVPGKGDHIWTYTFFIIREVKRKSGIWSSQGGKNDGQGYVPNVVAQMKVSDSPSSFTKADNTDHYITREFNLFAVDGDQYANDFHPTNELAAIVVKLPRSTAENDINDGESRYNWLDMAQEPRENLQEIRSSDSGDQSLKSVNFSTTVILPGGVHSVPSKGEISTLAERWRSGGSCDCGGWDLGCQLRVYTNKNEHERKTVSSGTFLNKHKFQLFSQGNQDSQSVLTLLPFKERIYSVDFSSSLSLLQAFAICMSFIDSTRPSELREPSVTFEKITEPCVFDVMQTISSNQGETPAKYVSNPPHSPVGRV